jgi:hypothetical protein
MYLDFLFFWREKIAFLFENSKTGSNPEKSNLHKKRFVLFREPPEKKKFENLKKFLILDPIGN